MVGEIRDLETASIAVQASLTGHMVFSTLHTNTAVGAITRMRDMGVEPFLLSSSLVAVLAQRLVRVLCSECRVSHTATEVEFEQIKNVQIGKNLTEAPKIYSPGSCSACNNTGYSGRSGIYELVAIDEKMRAMIHDIGAEQELEKYAHQHTASIRQDGIRLVLEGVTTLEEVMRVTKEDVEY
jgi:general secretion pathway protein E